MGGGTYKLRRVCISLIASLALSPGFVTNTLLGLSRPVGKGPGELPEKLPTTPCGAALIMCTEEANKPYGFFTPFPLETRVCGYVFHCIHWRDCPKSIIIPAKNEALLRVLIFYHLLLLVFRLNDVQTIPSPKLRLDHHQTQFQLFVLMS